MAAAQATGSNTVRGDPTIQGIVAAAKKGAAGEWKVTLMLEGLDKHKAAVAATQATLASCRDATMLPLWQTLAVKQADATVRAEECYQRFLNGDFDDADEAKNAISEALKTKGACAYTLTELQLCHTKTSYYKQRAAQAAQSARIAPLQNKCWTKAAVYTEEVAKMLIAYIEAGFPRGRDDTTQLHFRHLLL